MLSRLNGRFRIVVVAISLGPGAICEAQNHSHPTAEAIRKAREDGTYDRRLRHVMMPNPHRLSRGLAERAAYKVRRAALEATGMSDSEVSRWFLSGPRMAFPFPSSRELGSLGDKKTLTLLIDFKDFRAETEIPGMDAQHFHKNIYGEGTAEAQNHTPHESVKNYYRRASQGKVNVQGDVLGWHHLSKNRAQYEPATAPPGPTHSRDQWDLNRRAILDMAVEALKALDNEVHDFSQYDNDHDGDIDLITILYAGPHQEWADFWWAYQWEFDTNRETSDKFDGKILYQFVFQFVSTRGPAKNDFDPSTLIHEMGHAFGLADYYDYEPCEAPRGGVGELDMMDGGRGNHNAFSRWLLDWIDLKVIGSHPPEVSTLVASGSQLDTNKAIAIFPGLTNSVAPDQEMFIVENRTRFGNDAGSTESSSTPGNGLLIWHVDATVDKSGTDFAFNNSESQHKLIRLVRADTAKDFLEDGPADGSVATESTYFQTGSSFTPTSVPSSQGSSGPTNVSIDHISSNGESMTVNIGIHSTDPGPSAVADTGTVGLDQVFAWFAQDLTNSTTSRPSEFVDLDELERLDRMCTGAAAEQLEELWKLLALGKPVPRAASQSALAFQILLTHWARKDGPTAIQVVQDLPQSTFRSQTFALVISTWASNDAHTASSWYLDSDQAALRDSNDLVAGPGFAKTIFECCGRLDESKAILSLDKLTHSSELWGAVDALRYTNAVQGGDPDALSKKLKSLPKNGELLESFHRIQESLKDVRASVRDPKQRALLQEFLETSWEKDADQG